MDLLEAIKSRRSVRGFSKIPVTEEQIQEIIEAGIWAPSACNRQGWRFIRLQDLELRQRVVAEIASPFIAKAPIAILVCYTNRRDNLEYEDHVQSASACIQNMCLAATNLGLGSVWVNHLPTQGTMRRLFDIPWHFDPIAIVCFGHPKRTPKAPPRKSDVSDLISLDRFDFSVDQYDAIKPLSEENIRLFIKKWLRRCYVYSPSIIKRRLRSISLKFEKDFDKYTIEKTR